MIPVLRKLLTKPESEKREGGWAQAIFVAWRVAGSTRPHPLLSFFSSAEILLLSFLEFSVKFFEFINSDYGFHKNEKDKLLHFLFVWITPFREVPHNHIYRRCKLKAKSSKLGISLIKFLSKHELLAVREKNVFRLLIQLF